MLDEVGRLLLNLCRAVPEVRLPWRRVLGFMHKGLSKHLMAASNRVAASNRAGVHTVSAELEAHVVTWAATLDLAVVLDSPNKPPECSDPGVQRVMPLMLRHVGDDTIGLACAGRVWWSSSLPSGTRRRR